MYTDYTDDSGYFNGFINLFLLKFNLMETEIASLISLI